MRSEAAMAIWIVRATWIEDEDEVSEQWEVNAATAHEAVEDVTAHIRFPPHHVEARMRAREDKNAPTTSDLRPRQARRIPPQ
jgi:hypothetical protein